MGDEVEIETIQEEISPDAKHIYNMEVRFYFLNPENSFTAVDVREIVVQTVH